MIARGDNFGVLEHVHSINSATKGRRLIGFLDSNIEVLDINKRLPLSHIMGGLNVPEEMAKNDTRKVGNVIREEYPPNTNWAE